MKPLKLLFFLCFSAVFVSSCSRIENNNVRQPAISLEDVVANYDLWYVDYHNSTGTTDIPYMAKAFTISFVNGVLYANNNIAEIGNTGNGFGIDVGSYNTFNGLLETNHDVDGFNDFEVTVLSNNEIRLSSINRNVSYLLVGYQIDEFDYDMLFYENIEFFLQEYSAWKKVNTIGGSPNNFDLENFLQFTPENTTTFYSSQDNFNTPIRAINWNFVGSYEVFDVAGINTLKVLTLYYDGGDIEEFELSVINDSTIELFNINSNTTYIFEGFGFIQYLKSNTNKTTKTDRKRTRIQRNTKQKKKKSLK